MGERNIEMKDKRTDRKTLQSKAQFKYNRLGLRLKLNPRIEKKSIQS